MSKVIITIAIDEKDAEKMLKKIVKRSSDMRPVWRYAGRKLESSFSQNFLSGGALVPGKWAPLDASYAAWKAMNFPGQKKMFLSGKLFRSVSELSDKSVNKVNRLSAEFGTNVEYAKFHQYGTTKMPARKIIFEPRGFTRDIAEKVKEHVLKEGPE